MPSFFDIYKRWSQNASDLEKLKILSAIGKTYYVDGDNGDDDSSGKTRCEAFKTIQQGLDSITDGKFDTVLVLPKRYGGAYVENLAMEITTCWRLIGLGTPMHGVHINPTANSPIFYSKGAAQIEIANITWDVPNDKAKEALLFDILNYGWIHHNYIFGDRDSSTPTPTVGISTGTNLACIIEKNYINGLVRGLHFKGGADKFCNWTQVQKNYFENCSLAAIDTPADCVGVGAKFLKNDILSYVGAGAYGIRTLHSGVHLIARNVIAGPTGFDCISTTHGLMVDNHENVAGAGAVEVSSS